MTYRPEQRPTPFDTSHHTGLRFGNNFGQSNDIHGRVERREGFGTVSGWSREIATCDGHTCSLNRWGDVFDRFDNELFYVGRAYGDRDAVSRWKNYLMSIGVHTELVTPDV